MRTTADEKLDSASDHLREAIKDISSIVVDECYGHDDFLTEYRDTIYEVMQELIVCKKRLNR